MTDATLSDVWRSPRGRPLTCTFRPDTSDWNTLTSATNEDEYGLRDRRITGIAFDIGAHIGGVTVAMLVDNPDLHVVAVEPVADNCRLLALNAAANGVADRVAIVQAAAGPPGATETRVHFGFRGSETATHHAFIGMTDFGNAHVAQNWRHGTDHDISAIPAFDFAGLVDIGGGLPSFVKIDCEGAEFLFLRHPAVASVPVILGEWHNVPLADGDVSSRSHVLALLPHHAVTFSGPEAGPGGFVAEQ